MPVSKETMTYKDVEIELSVRAGPSGFYGAYFCLACRTGGVRYDPLLPEPEDANEEARVRAMAHCETEH